MALVWDVDELSVKKPIAKFNDHGNRIIESMPHFNISFVIFVLLIILGAGCSASHRAPEDKILELQPSLELPSHNMAIVNNEVGVARVVAPQSGWLVVYGNDNGHWGKLLGYTPVAEGESKDVKIKINSAGITHELIVVLYRDDYVEGRFEPDDRDRPVESYGLMVDDAFTVSNYDKLVKE